MAFQGISKVLKIRLNFEFTAVPFAIFFLQRGFKRTVV